MNVAKQHLNEPSSLLLLLLLLTRRAALAVRLGVLATLG